MTLLEKLKLLAKLNQTADEVEKGINMKSETKVMLAILGLLAAIFQTPSIQTATANVLASHPGISLGLSCIAGILALLHVPVKKVAPVLIFALMLVGVQPVMAQVVSPVAPDSSQNIYAAGISYNSAGTPRVGGTALYAYPIGSSGTYGFTVADFLPNNLKPLTVTNNVGTGIAQKIATVHNLPIYGSLAAGFSFNGSNTGWEWNTGFLTSIPLKSSHYALMPMLRLVKSSVSNGTGYQPVFGVLVRF